MPDLELDIDALSEDRVNTRGAGPRNDTGLGQLTPSAFVRKVQQQVTELHLGHDPHLQTDGGGSLCKFWFGPDKHVHYELWVHARTNQLELGLHCESTPEYNRELYAGFDRCLLDIQEQLGSQFWLEEWDHGWVRLYETHPLYPMDLVRVEEIAGRISEIIGALQPIYDEIASVLTPPTIVPAPPRRNSSRWRR